MKNNQFQGDIETCSKHYQKNCGECFATPEKSTQHSSGKPHNPRCDRDCDSCNALGEEKEKHDRDELMRSVQPSSVECCEKCSAYGTMDDEKYPFCRYVKECPCHHPTDITEKSEEWEEEFRKIGEGSVRFIATRMEVKDFIRTLIARVREEAIHDYQTNDEQRHIASALEVQRKDIVEGIRSLIDNNDDGLWMGRETAETILNLPTLKDPRNNTPLPDKINGL